MPQFNAKAAGNGDSDAVKILVTDAPYIQMTKIGRIHSWQCSVRVSITTKGKVGTGESAI